MENRNPSSSRADRKTIERNRRNQMKALYSTLNSLVPHQHKSNELLPLPDQLDEAVSYIKKLQINVERMKEKKESLKGGGGGRCSSHDQGSSVASRSSNGGRMAAAAAGLKLPHVDIHHVDSALEVVLITGLDYSQSMFNDVLRMLHEEGVDILSASFSALDNVVFHTIHSKIEESESSSYKAQRISERLHSFVNGAS